MTLYLDASSLVKLYVDEVGSDSVRALVERAGLVVTSSITYAEVRSTLARFRREKRATAAEYGEMTQRFRQDWSTFLSIAANDSLAESAGNLAELHALYGCDAIQLATFVQLLQSTEDEDIEFSSFDDRLNKAAKTLG